MKIRRIVGKSMEPAYTEGQVVVFRRSKKISSGDVVLAIVDGREVIKRIADVTKDTVYLLGDNATHSTDSRHYGFVAKNQLYGKIVLVIPFTAKRS
jgi:SOS-response transcriptional repressor LexA